MRFESCLRIQSSGMIYNLTITNNQNPNQNELMKFSQNRNKSYFLNIEYYNRQQCLNSRNSDKSRQNKYILFKKTECTK
jgi:hypothetical protein